MVRSNFGAVRLPLLGAAVLASFAASLSAQVVEKGRTYADLVATHPCNSGSSGRLARITDAVSSSSIGGGGGSTQVWAVCNGVDTWTLTAIGGGGGVSGLSTADGGAALSDNAIVRGDGTTGVQGSTVTVADSTGNLQWEGTTADAFEGNFTFADPTVDWTWAWGADGTLTGPLGGVVIGPASATDNAIVRFDSTTGKLVQNSSATITDTGTLAATVSSGIQALIVGRSAGATLEVYPGTTDVQIGTVGSHPIGFYVANGSPSLLIPVGGGIDITDKGTRPTCDSTVRGTFWVDEGGAGVADVASVCAKDGADAYAWHDLY